MTEPEKLIENSEDHNKPFRLGRAPRFIIFVIFFLIHTFNCSDGGVPSSSATVIKKELNLSNVQFGTYGSIVQVGRSIGTFVIMILLNYFNRKYVIFIGLLVKCSSFLIYLVTGNYFIIMIFRFIQGLSHVFTYVYFPAWVDQFGLQNYKTLMTSFMQIASVIGSVFGFSFTTFIGLHNWKWGFATLAFCILPLNFILLFLPAKYFHPSIFFAAGIKDEGREKEGKPSLFEYDEERTKKKEAEKASSDQGESKWLLLLKPAFVTIVLSRTIVMFTFMSIHYWIGDYYTSGLGLDPKKSKAEKAASYSTVSLFAPMIGSTIGSIICEKIGGYTRRISSFLCIIFACLSGCAAIAITIPDSVVYFSAALFAFFFFTNCMMPILIGIGFSCVGKKQKIASYGVNSLMCTFLGNFPAPTVYGYFNDKYRDTNPRMAMKLCTNYIWVSAVLLTINFMVRKDEEVKEEKKDIELTEVNDKEEK